MIASVVLEFVSFAGAVLLIAVSIIDYRHHRIPNIATYSAVGCCLAAAVVGAATGVGDHSLSALLGGFLFSGTLYVPHRIDPASMGFGDIKLAWPLGFVIGWTQTTMLATALAVALTLAGASVIGLAMAAFSASRQGEPMRRGQAVPFGPALSAAGMIAVLSAVI